MRRLLLLCAALSSGCAMYTHTPPLQTWNLAQGYRFEQPPMSPPPAVARNSDDLFVVLAFSGGGTRAAALSYGVLAQLRDVTFHWDPQSKQPISCNEKDPDPAAAQACREKARSLLDEVDVISSVSGGSFTAAYYALNHEGIFDETGPFHQHFLYYPVQRDLLGHAAYYPQNWLRLRSRVEIAANLYMRDIFHGATFDALQPKGRPYLILNATDASTGARFEFTQEQFDLLCSDLSKVPVARGVAASSAFPGLLNAMTVDSFNATGGCQYGGPGARCDAATRQCPAGPPLRGDWVELAMRDAYTNYRRYSAARETLAYRDPARQHLHLLDGGLADNIGLRSVLQSLNSTDRPLATVDGTPVRGGWSLLDKINGDPLSGTPQVKTIIVITVNARTNKKKTWDEKEAGPGTFSVIDASSGVPMGNFSSETLELLREYSSAAGLNQPGAPRFYALEVAFENVADPAEREFLSGMGTNFELDRFEVDCLIDRGARLLREATSVEGQKLPFADFVRTELAGTVTPYSPYPQPCTTATGKVNIATRGHFIDVGGDVHVTHGVGGDVEHVTGGGLSIRIAKPNGFGATVGYGTQSFRISSVIDGSGVRLGTLGLRTLSAGVFYARRPGPVEISVGLSGGYGFGTFDLTREARDLYARGGTFGLEPGATNAWVIKPNASIWHNLTSRFAVNVSAAYVTTRPRIRIGGTRMPDQTVNASAVQVSTGVAVKVF